MNKSWFKIIMAVIIWFSIYGLWVGLEIAFYREIQPRVVDNFIGLILFISLYNNANHWIDKNNNIK
jgi:hypothetical protein